MRSALILLESDFKTSHAARSVFEKRYVANSKTNRALFRDVNSKDVPFDGVNLTGFQARVVELVQADSHFPARLGLVPPSGERCASARAL